MHLHMAPHAYVVATSDASLRLRVEVRAEQLNAATALDLWQLAFESAEELQSVIAHPSIRKAFKTRIMMSFYDKLSQVFWVSENYLFHACAMQRIWNLTERMLNRQVDKGEKTRAEADEAIQLLASKLLLGALAVPVHNSRAMDLDIDPDKDKQQRMAILVGHQHHIPHRKDVIADLAQVRAVLQF